MGIDEDLKTALQRLALGYEYEERKVIAGKDGSPERVEITKRHMPPDFKAIQKIQLLRELGQWGE